MTGKPDKPIAKAQDFVTIEEPEYILVHCPRIMDNGASKSFSEQVYKWQEAKEKPIIFNFVDVETLSEQIYRPFVLLQQVLKKKERSIFTINIFKKEIANQIKMGGLETVFNSRGSLDEVLKQLGIDPGGLNLKSELMTPFLNGAKKFIESQCKTQVTPGKPYVKGPKEFLPADVAGVMKITGDFFIGTVAVCFPSKVYLAVYSGMAKKKFDYLSKEVAATAADMIKIIFNNAKDELGKKYVLQNSVPTVMVAQEVEALNKTRKDTIIIPFETGFGPFHMEFSGDKLGND